jgi:fucose permease
MARFSAAVGVRRHDPAVLYLGAFVSLGLAFTILGPALSTLRARAGVDEGEIGRLFVAQSVGYVVGALGGGRSYDRVAPHRLLALGLAVVAAALMIVPSLDRLVTMGIVFAVLGVGCGVVDVGANTLLVWSRGQHVARVMNLLHLCFGLGALGSPLLVNVGLRLATIVGGGLAVVAMVAALLIAAPEAPARGREEQADATRPILAMAAFFFVLYVGVEIGFAGWVDSYGEGIGFSGDEAAYLNAVFWGFFTVGRLIAAGLARLIEPRPMLLGACVLAVAAMAVMVVASGAAALVWVATAAFGLAAAPQFPMMITYMERHVHLTGSATSWFVVGAGLGSLSIPWAIGQWFDRSGADVMPTAVLMMAGATMVWFVLIDRVLGGRRSAATARVPSPA